MVIIIHLRKTDFFGYKEKSLGEEFANNMYVGFGTSKVNVEKKTYEYDYTTDNQTLKHCIYQQQQMIKVEYIKFFEDGDKIRRAKYY